MKGLARQRPKTLSTIPDGLVVALVASGNLFFRAELVDVGQTGVAAEEQLVDHHLTGDVLDLASAEVVGMGQHAGVGLGQVGQEALPDAGLGFDAGL